MGMMDRAIGWLAFAAGDAKRANVSGNTGVVAHRFVSLPDGRMHVVRAAGGGPLSGFCIRRFSYRLKYERV